MITASVLGFLLVFTVGIVQLPKPRPIYNLKLSTVIHHFGVGGVRVGR